MITLGGYYVEAGQRHQLDLLTDPTIAQVAAMLERCREAGIVQLERTRPGSEDDALAIYCSDSVLMPMLGYDTEDDHVVLTLTNENQHDGLKPMFGEPYPAKAMTNDLPLVREVCAQYLAGDMPWQLT